MINLFYLFTDVASYLGIVRPTIPPQFDKSVSTNLTVITANTAQLSCRIWNLGNQTVSIQIFLKTNLIYSRLPTYKKTNVIQFNEMTFN